MMVIFVAFIVLFVILFFFNHERNGIIKCNADTVIHRVDESVTAKLKIELSMNANNGVFYIDGELYKDNNVIGIISRRTFFNVIIINEDVLLTSTYSWVTEINNIDDALLLGIIIPEFYTIPNKSVAMFFTKEKSGYYLSTKTIPSVYCADVIYP